MKNILYLIAILGVCQGMFAMQTELDQQIESFRKQLNEAKRFANLGDFQKAWDKVYQGHPLYNLNYEIWERMNDDARAYIVGVSRRHSLNEFWALQHEIQQFVNQGKMEDARDKYNKLKAVYDTIKAQTPFGSTVVYESAIADLEKAIVQLQLKDVQLFADQGKYKEAYDLLNEIKALSTSEPSASEIKKLEKSLNKPQLENAQQLANQGKYNGAYEIINRLKALQVKEAWALEIKIKQQEAVWKKAQEPIKPVEEKWLFIKQMSGSEPIKKTDWQIQDQKLLLNLDAIELMTQETFADLIQQAKDKNLPFIFVMVQSGDATKFFPYFFGVDVLKSFMEDWRSEEKSENKKFINPMNREKVTNIGIYVMGDDKTLHLLKDKADINYLEKLIDYKGHIYVPKLGRRIHNYEFKPELTEPGMVKSFINNLYKEQGKPPLFNL